jgi:DNA repair exonuclease SbcCD nuclease subunit
MKFAHIADTHIKNLKYHYEYNVVFEQLYEKLRKENVDYIIHCGDIAHTKTQISPEFVEMCSDFFRNLEKIAPTYIILGNHDGNLKNSSRQDALTPIVHALNLPNLYLLKDSGETNLDDRFCLNVLSVFDEDNWTQPTDKDKINIALYHGSISGVKTDIGWTMENGEHDVNIFNNFDFAFLGDIHKTNQALDLKGRIRYCGSTIQQNHGETNDKGMLLWNIRDRDDWDCEHITFENPKPFFTIVLTPTGKMPRNLNVPKNARLRLVSENNLPLDAMRRALDVAKHKFKPETISFLNRAAGQRGDVEDLTNGLELENLRDVSIQEELMDEYLKDYQADSDTMDTIYTLNRRYNKIVEDNEEISRNVNWKINNFKWDNLFNYGEDNNIDFASLSGIIGIFGKNFSGKSSIIDAALYTMFNTTSKNERKNLNVINQHRDFGRGEVQIQVGTNRYTITRASEKYTKKLKGDETLEAKTDLNFEVHDEVTGETTSLNGTTRNKTDANIRKHFGAIEDFSMSSLASQHGAFSFIDEGSTKRKEIIAKFLDLEFFDKKFKLSKEDSQETKVLLKKSADREFDNEIEEIQEELKKAKEQTDNNIKTCSSLKKEIDALQKEMNVLVNHISSVPTQYIDIADVVSESENTKYRIRKLRRCATKR